MSGTMGSDSDTSDDQKDDSELEDSSNVHEILSGENGLLKSENLLSQNRQQCSVVSNTGEWLQIVKNGPKGSFSRASSFFDNRRIPRHLVSLDEKYLRRCLDLITISAFNSASCSLSMNLVGSKIGFSSSYFDLPVIPKENIARLVFDLPLVDESGCIVISPSITGCKRVTRMLDKPLLHNVEAMDGDNANRGMMQDYNSEKGLVSCDVLRQIEENYTLDSQFQSYESGSMPQNPVSLSSTNSRSSSSSEHSSSFWSPSSTVSQGTLQFTMKDNKMPHFVFSLDDQKEIYVASLSTGSVGSGFDRSALDYSYLIHLKKGRGSEPQYLVGKLKVSTLFSVSSESEKIVERQFVLFSGGGNPQLPCHNNDIRKNRGLPKKVVDALKSTVRASRQRSISRFSRTSSIPEICSWEPFQEPDHDLEPVSLLDNDLPSNLETSAVVVREEFLEEEEVEEKVGGWGIKFLKKTRLVRTKDASDNSKHTASIDVVIPSGFHGGPRVRNGGPSSLIQRWISGGSCDCSGWDLGCPLTVLQGQARKDQNESQCNLFELFTEGSKQGIPGLRIMSVRDGLYFVQFQAKLSVLQSFSIALAYIHSQNQRLRPWSSGKMYREA